MPSVKISGRIYDVGKFAERHPGGKEVLLSYDNLDATHVFREFHNGPRAVKILNTLPSTADTAEITEDVAIEEDFAALHYELEAEGRFTPSLSYYSLKIWELYLLLYISIITLDAGYWHISTIVTGLFFQQAGWLSHDFAHTQVVTGKYRSYFLYILGCLFQGFTATWWIPKHMMHHARPNAIDERTGNALDSDIDTAPFLYWTSRLLPSTARNYSRVQGYILWLVLPFSKFAWDYSSFVATWKKKQWTEIYLVVLHHVLCLAIPALFTRHWLAFYIMSRLWAGFFIGWVFIMSHNGMEYYERPNLHFYESQVRTTRNVSLNPFVTWFTGGLNYQIEHHLFPRMPRHHLPHVASRVRAICEKHGLAYIVESMWSCSRLITRYLNNVLKID